MYKITIKKTEHTITMTLYKLEFEDIDKAEEYVKFQLELLGATETEFLKLEKNEDDVYCGVVKFNGVNSYITFEKI